MKRHSKMTLLNVNSSLTIYMEIFAAL